MLYVPNYVGDDPSAAEEFQAIAEVIEALAQRVLPKLHAEPSKPRDGMLVYADGTDWNPGADRKSVV